MIVISELEKLNIEEPTAVCIGKFDGVHLGHRALLAKLLEAKTKGLKAAVFTFEPSPAVFFGLEDNKQITTRDEKRSILEDMGIDYLVEFPMNKGTARTSPEDFIKEYLVTALKAKCIICGHDLSFGYKGKGDFSLLKSYEKECGYEAFAIEKVCYNGQPISSTRIRSSVINGCMDEAADMIGAPYSYIGTIVHGAHLGTTIGFPTINIMPEECKLLPPFGVYFSRVTIGDRILNGITNVGTKPTVNATNSISVETYLYDFSEDVYDEIAMVELLEYKRGEERFDSKEMLVKQLEIDIEDGKKYFAHGSY